MHLMAIIGIVVVSLFVLVAAAAAIALLPGFLRYMKSVPCSLIGAVRC
jgi:hypothetical protein